MAVALLAALAAQPARAGVAPGRPISPLTLRPPPLLLQPPPPPPVTISNAVPRLDSSGEPVNAHSGNVVKMGDTYYLCE